MYISRSQLLQLGHASSVKHPPSPEPSQTPSPFPDILKPCNGGETAGCRARDSTSVPTHLHPTLPERLPPDDLPAAPAVAVLPSGPEEEVWSLVTRLNRGRYVIPRAPGMAADNFDHRPQRGLHIGPGRVVRVQRQAAQLRYAVDGDDGGAVGHVSASFPFKHRTSASQRTNRQC